jgi:hypothetical protein
MSTSTQQPPRASLLGLPVEIRLGIYDIIKDFDVGYLVNPMPFKTNSPRLPLRDLAISFRLLAQEIRAHRNALPDSERYATIDLTNYTMTLSHAPCRATDLNTLKLVYDFSVIDGSTDPWIDWGFLHHIAFIRTVLDLQIFFHARKDAKRPPPSKKKYERRVRRLRALFEPSRIRFPACVGSRVVRLMEFSYEPWK